MAPWLRALSANFSISFYFCVYLRVCSTYICCWYLWRPEVPPGVIFCHFLPCLLQQVSLNLALTICLGCLDIKLQGSCAALGLQTCTATPVFMGAGDSHSGPCACPTGQLID